MSDFLYVENLAIEKIPPARYILAVSGGIDSMVLLDILSQQPDLELIVAHFNHGIRDDSIEDEKLVKDLSFNKGFKFEVGHGKLSPSTSEEKAREARYEFLDAIRRKHRAKAIITAHHRDDLIESAIINMLRGSGRRGLSSMLSNSLVIRPLSSTWKYELMQYAKLKKLIWHEDYTNNETKYLRNYIRKNITPKLKESEKLDLVKSIENVAKMNKRLDFKIATLSQLVKSGAYINRSLFTLLPSPVAKELLIFWLRELKLANYDSRNINRLYINLKTSPKSSKHEVNNNWYLNMDEDMAYFSNNRVGRLI